MSSTLMPIAIEHIMRDRMERAAEHRRASGLRAKRRRPAPRARARRTLRVLVGRPA